MFRGLFGSKSDRPGPPKNQIEVVCPACGAAQFEPRLVVSTFCKKCGVHLSIQRKKVVASDVTRSGMGMPNPWAKAKPSSSEPTADKPKEAISAPEAPPAPEKPQFDDPLAAELTQPVSQEEAEEGGFGVFLKQQAAPSRRSPEPESQAAQIAEQDPDSEPIGSAECSQAPALEARDESPENLEAVPESAPETEEAPVTAADSSQAASDDSPAEEVPPPPTTSRGGIQRISRPVPAAWTRAQQGESAENAEPTAEKRAHSNAPPPTTAPAPMTPSTLQKMKSEGLYRNQYFKDADCFECGHSFKVSRSTRTAECSNCGVPICMEDVEINMHSGECIKTRGDVLIRKRGQVSAESILCKDLRCQGILEANVKATGDAIFRATGTMIGQVHCRRFIVEKGSDVSFENAVYAEEVEINARITATLFSSGSFVIGPNGSVNGDITARSVSIEPGGELNGAMNIVRNKPPGQA